MYHLHQPNTLYLLYYVLARFSPCAIQCTVKNFHYYYKSRNDIILVITNSLYVIYFLYTLTNRYRRYMDEILAIRRKTLSIQSINPLHLRITPVIRYSKVNIYYIYISIKHILTILTITFNPSHRTHDSKLFWSSSTQNILCHFCNYIFSIFYQLKISLINETGIRTYMYRLPRYWYINQHIHRHRLTSMKLYFIYRE